VRKVVLISVLALVALAAIAVAQVSLQISPSVAAWGSVVTIEVTAPAGSTCGVEIRNPYDNAVFTKQVDIPAAGYATAEWYVPPGAKEGTYTVYVSCGAAGTDKGTFKVVALKPVGGIVPEEPSLRALLAAGLLPAAAAVALIALRRRP